MKDLDFLASEITEGPLQKYVSELSYGRSILIKREELNHPLLQGNKWHKLKENLKAYYEGDFDRIISFGGPFSNHIWALSAACNILHIPLTIFVRGHQLDIDNPTIKQLLAWEIDIELLDFGQYREKASTTFIEKILSRYPDGFIIPEGGSNQLGMEGCLFFAKQLRKNFSPNLPDFVCLSAGTGATAAAVVTAFSNSPTRVLIFSSLKGVDFCSILKERFSTYVDEEDVIQHYHMGGYGKVNRELVDFAKRVYDLTQIILDPIYTAKLFYGVDDMLQKNYFDDQAKLCVIHSGGLQGIKGYNYRYGKKYGILPE